MLLHPFHHLDAEPKDTKHVQPLERQPGFFISRPEGVAFACVIIFALFALIRETVLRSMIRPLPSASEWVEK